jgi:hypothetical protein
MRWEVRDYRFDSGPKDARQTNHNIEFTLGSVMKVGNWTVSCTFGFASTTS